MRSSLNKQFTDESTDEGTDGRTHVGHHAMTIARWPLASGAKKKPDIRYSNFMVCQA